ncbi:hypothetical protein [Nocardia acidivorans]|uniref:hypothetical protein n=1 Tax=Nocardia acidivorans TaxID=404580 RepID=UPI00082D7832|nr:hypothetical protein [Nocardia acidivorans]
MLEPVTVCPPRDSRIAFGRASARLRALQPEHWAGLADTTIRVVDGDRLAGEPGIVALPCEPALYVWLAHRCEPALLLAQEAMLRCAGLDVRRFWSLVAESIVGAATYVPALAGTSSTVGAQRGQAMLAALADRGLPVRRGCVVR